MRGFDFRALWWLGTGRATGGSNVVLRWEFRPGSTAFLVWQHRQIERVAVGDFDLGRDVRALFGVASEDTFTLKVEYRFGR